MIQCGSLRGVVKTVQRMRQSGLNFSIDSNSSGSVLQRGKEQSMDSILQRGKEQSMDEFGESAGRGLDSPNDSPFGAVLRLRRGANSPGQSPYGAVRVARVSPPPEGASFDNPKRCAQTAKAEEAAHRTAGPFTHSPGNGQDDPTKKAAFSPSVLHNSPDRYTSPARYSSPAGGVERSSTPCLRSVGEAKTASDVSDDDQSDTWDKDVVKEFSHRTPTSGQQNSVRSPGGEVVISVQPHDK
eukprot:CAMPEP_0174945262 /NCGR_PEP_ID=MMETSP1355-20121228/81095_1 /TAXON_ID=464990 /ORGANISM="Hemiselmis tepida, Strain CCMP443" /LENGTH=240 /DNA_ID=CAMNT_0016192623 /DNA_START=180 /DNA_END=902 /DNA_ORIENTATION=-